jgi:hypothetical protein
MRADFSLRALHENLEFSPTLPQTAVGYAPSWCLALGHFRRNKLQAIWDTRH